jgi:tRNA ligase
MMFCDRHEITKSLSSKGENQILPKNKTKRPETRTYVERAKREMKSHPELFEG